MSVVYSGLLDRYPHLRIMFTQGGGWIQYGVGRLDLRYQQYEKARPMKRPPAEYLTRMYFDCLVHDEDALALLVKRAGSEHVFIGTDYPAGGDIPGGAVRWIKECTLLSSEVKENILWKNARRFLRLA
jgi:aminocarboxymuconate-semialdehyde decarboxylase